MGWDNLKVTKSLILSSNPSTIQDIAYLEG
jgi:hypothetical protein